MTERRDMTELVKISTANGVMEVLWNRPDKKNALSNAMYRAATAALAQAVEDKSIAAVILGSTGDSFTSGNDLADFAAAATGGGETAAGGFIEAIAQFPRAADCRRAGTRMRRGHDDAAAL